MKRLITMLLAMLLLLSMTGCKQEQIGADSSTNSDAEIEKVYQTQSLEPGKLSTEPLDTSASFSRAAYTGRCRFAETAGGYYCVYNTILYYADKQDLTNWVPVCSRPECKHTPEAYNCNARIKNEFLVTRDYIYFCEDSQEFEQTPLFGQVLTRMKPDGADREIAYIVQDAMASGGHTERFTLFPDQMIACMALLQEDGTFTGKIIRVDETGETLLFEDMIDPSYLSVGASAGAVCHMGGEPGFYSTMPIGDLSELYGTTGEQLEVIGSVEGLDLYGPYLSGSTLLTFVRNDGYYTIDLTTGARLKAADCQLSGSWGFVFEPNCILETTLPVGPEGGACQTGGGSAMVLYDGASWCQVALPGELSAAEEGAYLEPLALTSDRILFGLHTISGLTCRIYQLPLNAEALELTFCAQIGG